MWQKYFYGRLDGLAECIGDRMSVNLQWQLKIIDDIYGIRLAITSLPRKEISKESTKIAVTTQNT